MTTPTVGRIRSMTPCRLIMTVGVIILCFISVSGFTVNCRPHATTAMIASRRDRLTADCDGTYRYETTKRWAATENSDTEKSSGGKARFSGIESSSSDGGFTNVFDYLLSLISSDVGSIVLGLVGLVLAVGNRLAEMDSLSTETLGQETRSDLLAVFASGAVLLNGVSKLDVTSALAESVTLEGTLLSSPVFQNYSIQTRQKDIEWAMTSVLAATPAKTAVLLTDIADRWSISALAGIVPSDPSLPESSTTPILDRFRTNTSKESYLPTLQALPGRVEFTYLPPNTQEALLLPVASEGGSLSVLVLGSDTAKSFTPRDVAWCQVLASRIATFLQAD